MVFASYTCFFWVFLRYTYVWYPTFVFCGSNAALPLRKLLLLQSIDQYWRWTSYKHKKKWQWNVTWNRTFSFSCHENMIENKHLSWILIFRDCIRMFIVIFVENKIWISAPSFRHIWDIETSKHLWECLESGAPIQLKPTTVM